MRFCACLQLGVCMFSSSEELYIAFYIECNVVLIYCLHV